MNSRGRIVGRQPLVDGEGAGRQEGRQRNHRGAYDAPVIPQDLSVWLMKQYMGSMSPASRDFEILSEEGRSWAL